MLIRKIKLKNFFCFINQEIELASGVNIISGDNNFGKSAIFSAIKWCFQGGGIIKEKILSKSEIFNRLSKKNNEDELSVSIEFDYEGSNFLLVRKSIIKSETNFETLQDTDFDDSVNLQKNNEPIPKNQVEEEIDKILPDYAIDTLFFDGEELFDIVKNILNIEGNEQKLLDKLRDTIGIPYYEKISSICNEKISDFKKQRIKKLQQSTIANDTSQKLELVRQEIEEQEQLLENYQTHLKDFNEDIKKIEKEINQYLDQAGKLERKKELLSLKKYHEENKEKLIEKNKNIISADDFWESFLSKFLKENYDHSKLSKSNLKDQLQYLKKIEETISIDCKGEIKKFISDVNNQIENCEEDDFTISNWQDNQSVDSYKDNVKNIKREYQDINNVDAKIEKLTNDLRGFDAKKYIELNDKKDLINGSIRDTNKKIEDTESSLSIKKAEERTLERDLNTDDEAKKILKEIDLKIKFTEELCQLFDKSRYQHLDSIKNDIQNNSADIYRKITREDGYKTGGLILSDNWQVSILNNDKNKITLSLVSTGTKHCVALSIYAGLFQAIDPNRPFIGDSIFGRLDPTHKKNILNQSDKFGSQMILLLTTSEHADLGQMENSFEWNTLRIDKKSDDESEFSKANLLYMDEERIKTIKEN